MADFRSRIRPFVKGGPAFQFVPLLPQDRCAEQSPKSRNDVFFSRFFGEPRRSTCAASSGLRSPPKSQIQIAICRCRDDATFVTIEINSAGGWHLVVLSAQLEQTGVATCSLHLRLRESFHQRSQDAKIGRGDAPSEADGEGNHSTLVTRFCALTLDNQVFIDGWHLWRSRRFGSAHATTCD